MIHQMKLRSKPFESIKKGTKTIELRLYDEKRRLLKEKDIITFTNVDTGASINVIINKLHFFSSFKELYKSFDKKMLGYENNENASYKDMDAYYTVKEQEMYGVIGIEIERIGE